MYFRTTLVQTPVKQLRQEMVTETPPSAKIHQTPSRKKVKPVSQFECGGGANDQSLAGLMVSKVLIKNNMYPYISPTKDESEEKVDYEKLYFEALKVNAGLKATIEEFGELPKKEINLGAMLSKWTTPPKQKKSTPNSPVGKKGAFENLDALDCMYPRPIDKKARSTYIRTCNTIHVQLDKDVSNKVWRLINEVM
jgi:hypothetical protein